MTLETLLILGLTLSPMCVSATKGMRVFADRFESSSPTGWHLFEEIVTSCYTDSVASLVISDDVKFKGDSSFAVKSNDAGSVLSNHVIAGNNILDEGVDGTWQYRVKTLIPSESFSTTQVGPEFSFQNTRMYESGVTYTSIAGVQYIASQYISNKWNVWVETSPNTAQWQESAAFSSFPALEADKWYTFKLNIDFDKNEYISFVVKDLTAGTVHKASLTGIPIAEELRGFAPASVITLEAENLYSNCGTAGVFKSTIYYDNAAVWNRTKNA